MDCKCGFEAVACIDKKNYYCPTCLSEQISIIYEQGYKMEIRTVVIPNVPELINKLNGLGI